MHLLVQSPAVKGEALSADAQIGDHRATIARILEPCLPPARRPAARVPSNSGEKDPAQAGRE